MSEQNSTNEIPSLESILSLVKPKVNESSDSEKGNGDILTGLLSNPEMLAKLPAMIDTVKPLLQNLPSSPSKNDKEQKGELDKRTALLLALKPYMSKSRCDAIDYIIKICGITEMFK